MYPGPHAQKMPDKAAAINTTTGEVLTYGDLNHRSIQLARYGMLMGCDRVIMSRC
jgi:long-chain acyl-CoA synthetase